MNCERYSIDNYFWIWSSYLYHRTWRSETMVETLEERKSWEDKKSIGLQEKEKTFLPRRSWNRQSEKREAEPRQDRKAAAHLQSDGHVTFIYLQINIQPGNWAQKQWVGSTIQERSGCKEHPARRWQLPTGSLKADTGNHSHNCLDKFKWCIVYVLNIVTKRKHGLEPLNTMLAGLGPRAWCQPHVAGMYGNTH